MVLKFHENKLEMKFIKKKNLVKTPHQFFLKKKKFLDFKKNNIIGFLIEKLTKNI